MHLITEYIKNCFGSFFLNAVGFFVYFSVFNNPCAHDAYCPGISSDVDASFIFLVFLFLILKRIPNTVQPTPIDAPNIISKIHKISMHISEDFSFRVTFDFGSVSARKKKNLIVHFPTYFLFQTLGIK